jgi:hypothetical protein
MHERYKKHDEPVEKHKELIIKKQIIIFNII